MKGAAAFGRNAAFGRDESLISKKPVVNPAERECLE
jgi:hypothetical protein